jgi:hypothetical protein
MGRPTASGAFALLSHPNVPTFIPMTLSQRAIGAYDATASV